MKTYTFLIISSYHSLLSQLFLFLFLSTFLLTFTHTWHEPLPCFQEPSRETWHLWPTNQCPLSFAFPHFSYLEMDSLSLTILSSYSAVLSTLFSYVPFASLFFILLPLMFPFVIKCFSRSLISDMCHGFHSIKQKTPIIVDYKQEYQTLEAETGNPFRQSSCHQPLPRERIVILQDTLLISTLIITIAHPLIILLLLEARPTIIFKMHSYLPTLHPTRVQRLENLNQTDT